MLSLIKSSKDYIRMYQRLFFFFLLGLTTLYAKPIQGLGDYDFIGEGYGAFTTPSIPKVGQYKPCVPDLSHIQKADVLYVSPKGGGSGKTSSSPSRLSSLLSLGSALTGKTIIALDGTYDIDKTIMMENLTHVNIIAQNKWGAKINAQGNRVFRMKFSKSGTVVHDVSIIGFEAYSNHPNTPQTAQNKEFLSNAGTAKGDQTYNIYLADIKWHDFPLAIYSGLHSHDWTVDRCLYYDASYSYMWYMMGWHHTVMNSLMYNTPYYALALRGSYPLDEFYNYKGGNPPLSCRKKHHLDKDDWTHLIINNTFGSNYSLEREKADPTQKAWAHIALFYSPISKEAKRGKGEISYFPPQNVRVYNNAFIDQSSRQYDPKTKQLIGNGYNRYPLAIMAYKGLDGGDIARVNGTLFQNNMADHNQYLWNSNTQKHEYDIFVSVACPNYHDKKHCSRKGVNIEKNYILQEEKFGFDDAKRDYAIRASSSLRHAGSKTLYAPNVDFLGKPRRGVADVGAYSYFE